VHDAHVAGSGTAYLLSLLAAPAFPVPLGVFRAVEASTYDALDEELRAAARARSGRGRLEQLLSSGTTWTIE
jgi:2-oxoglutarate ferredoxin oxidoreductase subunit beta